MTRVFTQMLRSVLRSVYRRTLPSTVRDAVRLQRELVQRESTPVVTDPPAQSRIVVLAPHMDDEVFGCGGTLARAAAQGSEVRVVFITDGSRGWHVLLLDGLPSKGNRLKQLVSVLKVRGLACGPVSRWPHVYLRFDGAWDEFLRKKARKFRKHFRQSERSLAKLGELSVERFAGADAAARGMQLFLSIDRGSWKAQEGESMDLDSELREYYRSLCERLGARGRAEVWVLRVGSVAAAAYLCLCDGRSRYTLKTSYREIFGFGSRHSPSNVLLEHIIRQTWGLGGAGIDFVGKMPFVERWANEECFYEQAVFYRSRLWALRMRVRDTLGRLINKGKAMARRVRDRRSTSLHEPVGTQSSADAAENRGPELSPSVGKSAGELSVRAGFGCCPPITGRYSRDLAIARGQALASAPHGRRHYHRRRADTPRA